MIATLCQPSATAVCIVCHPETIRVGEVRSVDCPEHGSYTVVFLQDPGEAVVEAKAEVPEPIEREPWTRRRWLGSRSQAGSGWPAPMRRKRPPPRGPPGRSKAGATNPMTHTPHAPGRERARGGNLRSSELCRWLSKSA